MKVFCFYANYKNKKPEIGTVFFRAYNEVLEETIEYAKTIYILSDKEIQKQKAKNTKLKLIKS